ncbi:MAG: branched-chain amino acid transaminase [Campylobacterales bacterium]|nr:branched-chain amino acid transaminase [Campylobacterales bacterium]
MEKSKYIWINGEFVGWDNANVHVLSHTLHYGNGAIEGTKAYMTDNGLAIFRLNDHTKRLINSAKITLINVPYSVEELNQAQIELLRKNEFTSGVYIRPIVFLGYGVMGVYHKQAPVMTAIASWPWGAYLGEDGLKNGVRVKISSFTRNSNKSTMGKAKAVANYLNSQMAKFEAVEAGYDEALLLDDEGFIAEASGACFFIVRDGVLISPPNDTSLESITQATVIELATDMGLEVVRKRVTRDEVYIADEAFFTGTAAEITPIREVDARVIGCGKRGEITEKLQQKYFDVVSGKDDRYKHYLTYI